MPLDQQHLKKNSFSEFLMQKEVKKISYEHQRGIYLGWDQLPSLLNNFSLCLSFWREQELGKSKQDMQEKFGKKCKKQIQYTNKKKRQTEAFRDVLGVKPKLVTGRQGQVMKYLQPKNRSK